MAFLLFYGVVAVNFICVMTRKKNNVIALFSVVSLGLVMGHAATAFGDLASYAQRYHDLNFEFTNIEAGYVELVRFFSTLGFSFDQFRMIIFSICSLLLFFSVRRITNNYNMVILLYALTMFYFLAVALRFYIAFSITVFALTLLWKDKKRYIIVCVLLILWAAQFHKSVYITFLFLLAILPTSILKNINKVLLLISVLSFFLTLFLAVSPDLIAAVADLTKRMMASLFGDSLGDLLDSYLGEGYSRRYFLYYLFYLFGFLVSFVSLKALKANNKVSENFAEKYMFVATLSLATGFLVVVSQTFIRLLFIPLFMGFIVFAKLAENDKKEPIDVTLNQTLLSVGVRNVLIISTALTWFIMLYVIGDLSFDLSWFLSTNKL